MYTIFAIIFVTLSATLFGTSATQIYRLRIDETTDIKNAPYVAAIILYNKFHCNSAIISPQYVLTTAGCMLMIKNRLKDVRIHTGSSSLFRGGDSHKVETYFMHNKTLHEIEEGILYTVALLKLVSPMTVRPTQKPIRIGPIPEELYYSDPAQFFLVFYRKWYGSVAGWGKNWAGEDKNFDIRKTEEAVIQRILRCKRFLNEAGLTIYSHTVCAYHFVQYFGNDSSVLVYNNHLIGLASYFDIRVTNHANRVSYASVFTYIYDLRHFIQNIVGDLNSFPHYGKSISG